MSVCVATIDGEIKILNQCTDMTIKNRFFCFAVCLSSAFISAIKQQHFTISVQIPVNRFMLLSKPIDFPGKFWLNSFGLL